MCRTTSKISCFKNSKDTAPKAKMCGIFVQQKFNCQMINAYALRKETASTLEHKHLREREVIVEEG